MSKVSFAGKEFKGLIAAVTRFSNVGSFGGSESINLRVKNGWAKAATGGIVLSKSKIKADGELPLIALDARMLEQFSTICPDDHKFTIEVTDTVRLKHRREEVVPLTKGAVYQSVKPEELKDATLFTVTKELSEQVAYLSAVAFSDTSRPDLNCVMLSTHGTAVACSQKVVAELKFKDFTTKNKIAVPTQMASIITNGDEFWAGEKWTVLQSGNSKYEIPSPVRAQKEFPLDAIVEFSQVKRKTVCILSGQQLSEVVQDCNTCLSQLSKLDFKAEITGKNGKVSFASEKGGAKFRSMLQGTMTDDFQLTLPMDELLRVDSFLAKEKLINIEVGTQNGETFLGFSNGWVMLPRLKQ